MKLEDIRIDAYLAKYGETMPSIGHIIKSKPRKREVKLLSHLLLNNMKNLLREYNFQYTGVPSQMGYAVTFVCGKPCYDDGEETSILSMSKFAKGFGIKEEDLGKELEKEIKQGGLKLGDTVLVSTMVGPFEMDPSGTQGQTVVRVFVQDKSEYLEQQEKQRIIQQAVDEDKNEESGDK